MKYFTDIENARRTLDELGYCVVLNVLNEDECNEMNNGMWETLEYMTKGRIQRDVEESWSHFYDLMPKHSMLIQNWSFGHAQYLWNLRQNPKIASIFAGLWNVRPQDLLVSFDGASIHFPPEVTKRGWIERTRNGVELHVDQSLLNNDLQAFQGWVTANPIREGDATLVVLAGSHKLHADFYREAKREKKLGDKPNTDWYKLDESQVAWHEEERGCERVFIQCPAGSLVLWDSRTIHTGVQASKTRKEPNLRNIAYVCYTPRSMASESVMKKRRGYFEKLHMTSHLPHNPRQFPKTPRTYGKEIQPMNAIPTPRLTELGRRLVGL